MNLIGKGILKGLGVTLKHFFMTYVDEIRNKVKGLSIEELTLEKSSAQATGIFTIQYPEQQLLPPEEYR